MNSNPSVFQMSKGAQFMLFSVFLFSIMQLLVKSLQHIPFVQLIFFRALISAIFSYTEIKKRGLNPFGNHKPLLLGRGFFGAMSLGCFFYALQNAPLGSVVTIVNIKPFLVLLFAVILLKERIYPLQWIFFLCSFIGIFLIKGFDNRINTVELLAIVGAALFASIAHTCVRKLKGTDEPVVILFYFTIVTLPFATSFSIQHWVQPNLLDWIAILSIGVVTHFAQLFLTKAYQSEHVSDVSNIYYLGIIFALIYGYFFFDEKYSFAAIIGMILVIGGIFLNIFYLNHKKT